ncbi:MAG: TIR domain-containing protein [Aggregatilineales bacterium]
MTDVFISYSRRDGDFARQIHATLKAHSYDIWMDWEDIPLTANWWEEIKRGIEGADSFAFIVSSHSIESPICQFELDVALLYNKRIIPIIRQQVDIDASFVTLAKRDLDDNARGILQNREILAIARNNWNALARHNWIFFDDDTLFDERFDKMLAAITADLEHVRQHTDILNRALKWERRGENVSYMLTGDEISEAESWLANAQDKDPLPTQLHQRFITTSRETEHRRQRLLRRLRNASVVLALVGVVALIAMIVSINRASEAQSRVDIADATLAAFDLQVAEASTQLAAVSEQVAQSEARIESLRLAEEANTLLNATSPNAELAALLSIRALQTGFTEQANQSLIYATNRLFSVGRIVNGEGFVLSMVELSDGHWITRSSEGTMREYTHDISELVAVYSGHTDLVGAAHELSDGRIVSWGYDGTIRFWLRDGTLLNTTQVYEDDRIQRGFLLQDEHILTWNYGVPIRIFDNQGALLAELDIDSEETTGKIIQLRNGHILIDILDNVIPVWSAEGTRIPSADMTGIRIHGMRQLRDGRVLTWGGQASIDLWDDQGIHLISLEGHDRDVWGAIELQTGNILSWSDDTTLRLWETDGESIAVLRGHTNRLAEAIELSDGRILSWDENATLRLWSSDGEALNVMTAHTSTIDGAVELSDGRFATYGGDDVIRVWSSDGTSHIVLEGHTGNIRGLTELSPDRLLSWSHDSSLRLWQPNTDSLLRYWSYGDMEFSVPGIDSVIQLADGRYITVKNGYTTELHGINGELLLEFDVSTSNVIQLANGNLFFSGVTGPSWIYALDGTRLLDFSERREPSMNDIIELSEGRFIAISSDRELVLWSATGDVLAQQQAYTDYMPYMIALRDGRVVSFGEDSVIRIWIIDDNTFVLQSVLEGHAHRTDGVLELENGNLVSWGADDTLHLWDSNGTSLAFLDHTDQVEGATQLPDGQILSWSRDNTLRTWSAEDGTPIAIFEGHGGDVLNALPLEDGRILSVSITRLGLWDINGTLLDMFVGHTDLINGVRRLSDGRILSWSRDGSLRIWDMETGESYALEGHTSNVLGAFEMPDGRIMSWEYDGIIQFWFPDPEAFIDYACGRVVRDFTNAERQQYRIPDDAPTCPQFVDA